MICSKYQHKNIIIFIAIPFFMHVEPYQLPTSHVIPPLSTLNKGYTFSFIAHLFVTQLRRTTINYSE